MKNKVVFFLLILFAGSLSNSRGQNSWTQKADYGGIRRINSAAFSIGNKGYVGTGLNDSIAYRKDWWEYNPTTDAWTQVADMFNMSTSIGVGFSIGDKGYFTCGSSLGDELLEYDPALNQWNEKMPFMNDYFGYHDRCAVAAFSIGNKGYVGTGWQDSALQNDFWEYDPATDSWTQMADFAGIARWYAVGFSIGTKGYIGTGSDSDYYHPRKDFYEYDPATNTWTQKADFGGTKRLWAVGFSIGSKGYIGTGSEGDFLSHKKDWWEYDPATNSWTQKNHFGGTARYNATAFVVGNKGYVGTGYDGSGQYKKDFWEFDPSANSCVADFYLVQDTSIPHHYWGVNNASGANPLSYVWSWGDGTYDTIAYPSHTYANAGYYDICLSIHDSTGCFDSLCLHDYLQKLSAENTMVTVDIIAGEPSSTTHISQVLQAWSVFPNPAAGRVTVNYSLSSPASIIIEVYDVLGNKLLQPVNEKEEVAEHHATISTQNLPNGIYFIKIHAGDQIESKKLVVMK